MIYSLEGELVFKEKNFLLLNLNGINFKIYCTNEDFKKLPNLKERVKIFTFFYLKENLIEIYGFLNETSLKIFEMLINVSGIGPKTALNILNTESVDDLILAIVEQKSDLLVKISGIGKKTAERVILELHNKLNLPLKEKSRNLDLKIELEEILYNLGYNKNLIREKLKNLNLTNLKLEEALKQALKLLSEK